MPRIRTEVITDFSRLQQLACCWHRLWKASHRRDIFNAFGWARASWKVHGSGRSLCTPVVFQGDEVVGILPLVAEGRKLRFLGSPRSDYNDLLCQPDAGCFVLDAALRALSALPASWDRCELEGLPDDSNIVTKFDNLASEVRTRSHLSLSSLCPRVVFAPDRDQVISSIVNKKSLRRHENKLQRLGEVRFWHAQSREEIHAHLPAFFRQHIARRAMAGERSIFCEGQACNFYRALVDELDPREELRFAVLEVNRQPIAYHCGFETNGKFVWYKPTFDIDFWDYSPGEVLLKKLFEYVKERDVREFDFTVGNEDFKSRFANQVGQTYTLEMFPVGFRGRLRHSVHRLKEPVKKCPRLRGLAASSVAIVKAYSSTCVSALKRLGVLGATKKALAATWRTLVFARHEVVVFSADGNTTCAPEGSLLVEPGTLAGLACLAAECPEVLTKRQLHQARDMLRRGDRLFFARLQDAIVHVAWVQVQNQIAFPGQDGSQCRIDLGQPEEVISEWWTPSAHRDQGVHAEVLRTLVGFGTVVRYWTYCRKENTILGRSIVSAGFRPQYRVERIRVLGRWARSRVVPMGDHRPASAEYVNVARMG